MNAEVIYIDKQDYRSILSEINFTKKYTPEEFSFKHPKSSEMRLGDIWKGGKIYRIKRNWEEK